MKRIASLTVILHSERKDIEGTNCQIDSDLCYQRTHK
jgi:hypothetical protein